MASRNKKSHASKQTGSRSVQSAPARSSRIHNLQQARSLQSSSGCLPKTVSRKYTCTKCAKCFSTQTELSQHSKDKHGTKPPGSNIHKHTIHGLQNKKQIMHTTSPSCFKGFSSPRELEQHRKDKHQCNQAPKVASLNISQQNQKMFTCTFCVKGFSDSRELSQHTRDKHKIDEASFIEAAKSTQSAKNILNGVTCIYCNKNFSNVNELSQHQRDKHKIDPPKNKFKTLNSAKSCPLCHSQFSTPEALMQHRKDIHSATQYSDVSKPSPVRSKPGSSEFKCTKCPKVFPSSSQLIQHIKDKHQLNVKEHDLQTRKLESSKTTTVVKSDKMASAADIALKRNERKKTIDEYYAKKVDIDKDEKKISVRLVNDTLSKLMGHVNSQKGGDIYCPNHVKAGSFPVNTKIGKSDEFDTNICLKVGQQDLKVSRGKTIHYSYGQVV